MPAACLPSCARLLLAQAPNVAPKPAPPSAPAPEAPPPIDIATLRKALAAKPTGPAATALADKLRNWFGEEGLKNGTAKTEGLDAVFAIEAPGAKAVTAQSVDGLVRRKLAPIGEGPVLAAVDTLADGTALRFIYNVDGRQVGGEVETYARTPTACRGRASRGARSSSRSAGRARSSPAPSATGGSTCRPSTGPASPAAVMVFQDGDRST